MNKRRKKLVMCLTGVFLFILFFLVMGIGVEKYGFVGDVIFGNAVSKASALIQYLPAMAFIGLIILSLVYLERF